MAIGFVKPFHVWTVNNPQEMKRFLDMGAGGMITDQPDLTLDAFEGVGSIKDVFH